MRTKEIASLTDADVIVFVNNTQLDAADQLRLPKGPTKHTKSWKTQRHSPTSPLISLQSPPPHLTGGAAVWAPLP